MGSNPRPRIERMSLPRLARPAARLARRVTATVGGAPLHRGVDSAVLWMLGMVDVPGTVPDRIEPVNTGRFWAESRVHQPEPLTVRGELRPRARGTVRVFDADAPSHGPGDHPGSRRAFSRLHLNLRADAAAPMVILVHGYGVSNHYFEARHARLLAEGGAHSALIELPYHFRRRIVGTNSGAGFFSADVMRTRDTIRQATEDVASLVAWARREVTSTVAVLGVSLGGLVASLAAARLDLDSAMLVIPAASLPEIFVERAPLRTRRRLGVINGSGGPWGPDASAARALLDSALAPGVPRDLTPLTPPDRITVVAAEHDQVVGSGPARDLAAAWGTECWSYPHGHITVMVAPGLTRRMHHRLLEQLVTPDPPADMRGLAAGSPAGDGR